MSTPRSAVAILIVSLASGMLAEQVLFSAEPVASPASGLTANQWVKLDKADVKRNDVPLIYHPALKRFLVLGGSVPRAEYPQPHPFDELALDTQSGQWENWLPQGQNWGPRFGDCQAPGWKSESWGLRDAAGNCRPNLTTYRGLWLA